MPRCATSPYQNQQLIAAVREHIHALSLDHCIGVTLTMKQGVDGHYLDEIRASQNLRHFMNVLNREVFGKGFKRFGSRLNVVPALEKSPTSRLHYHMVLQNPYPENPDKFERMIDEAWDKTRFGYRETHVHRHIDHGWTNYITKTASDGIDWENYHWN
jgi:hypothetical protein